MKNGCKRVVLLFFFFRSSIGDFTYKIRRISEVWRFLSWEILADDDGMMSPSAPGIDHSNNNINKDNNEDEDDDVEDEERE